MKIKSVIKPELDGSFVPFAVWNREFQKRADCPVTFVLLSSGGGSRYETRILPNTPENRPLNLRYLERTLKFLLWQRGAETVRIAGCDELTSELAFAPVDLRADAPADEWSGDCGCGVQYFSQQAVARLAPAAGFDFPSEMPFAEQLVQVQERMAAGDERAAKIYSTIGTCFGYALAHWADFYELRNILLLGRVTSGAGGSVIIEKAETVLNTEVPDLGKKLRITMPDEQMKRHGQAVAAASLPDIGTSI